MEQISEEYKSYIELREILKYVDLEIVKKIPNQIISYLNSISSSGYEFKYDFTKSLNDQNIHKHTKELLSGIYIKYCCDEKTAKELMEKCKNNDVKPSTSFENINSNQFESIQSTANNEKAVTGLSNTKKSFFSSLFSKIKKLFKNGE